MRRSNAAHAEVARLTAKVAATGAVPVFVVYNIPHRDCGQHSAGGARGGDAYRRWIQAVAAGMAEECAPFGAAGRRWPTMASKRAGSVSGDGTSPFSMRAIRSLIVAGSVASAGQLGYGLGLFLLVAAAYLMHRGVGHGMAMDDGAGSGRLPSLPLLWFNTAILALVTRDTMIGVAVPLLPLRWLGVNAGLRAMALADAEERFTGKPSRIARLVKPLVS